MLNPWSTLTDGGLLLWPFPDTSSTTGAWAHNDDTEGTERALYSKIKSLFTSVKDQVCECIRLGLGLLNTRRTYFPQVGGAKLSISRTSPALADDGFTDGGEEPSWRSRPPPVCRHSWDLLWGSWGEMNSCKHTPVNKSKAKKLNHLVNIKRLVHFTGVRYCSKPAGDIVSLRIHRI